MAAAAAVKLPPTADKEDVDAIHEAHLLPHLRASLRLAGGRRRHGGDSGFAARPPASGLQGFRLPQGRVRNVGSQHRGHFNLAVRVRRPHNLISVKTAWQTPHVDPAQMQQTTQIPVGQIFPKSPLASA